MKDHTIVNRVLLGLLGLLLLGGGLTVIAAGADVFRRWNLSPPDGWPLTSPGNVLLPATDQTRWITEGWWWPTVIAGLALLLVLALAWLLSQSRHHRARRLPVGDASPDAVGVDERALDDALTADLTTLPGVRRADAHLTGAPTRPRARVTLTLDDDASPAPVIRSANAALDRTRRTAGWDRLPARLRLRVARHAPHRVG